MYLTGSQRKFKITFSLGLWGHQTTRLPSHHSICSTGGCVSVYKYITLLRWGFHSGQTGLCGLMLVYLVSSPPDTSDMTYMQLAVSHSTAATQSERSYCHYRSRLPSCGACYKTDAPPFTTTACASPITHFIILQELLLHSSYTRGRRAASHRNQVYYNVWQHTRYNYIFN